MAARLLGLRVRILPWAWMFVCCVCCTVRIKRQQLGQSGQRSTNREQRENPVGARNFSLVRNVQIGSGAHAAFGLFYLG